MHSTPLHGTTITLLFHTQAALKHKIMQQAAPFLYKVSNAVVNLNYQFCEKGSHICCLKRKNNLTLSIYCKSDQFISIKIQMKNVW